MRQRVFFALLVGGEFLGPLEDDQNQAKGCQGNKGPAPAKAQREAGCQKERADQVGDRAGGSPARHHLRLATGIQVHQRSLREGDEGAAGREADDHADQHHREAVCGGDQHQR